MLNACAADYETFLVYLEIALQLSTRCISGPAGLAMQNWKTLAEAAARGDPGLATDARDQILHLQRTMLYARHKGIVHPRDHICLVSFGNVGNITFWRVVPEPDGGTALIRLDDPEAAIEHLQAAVAIKVPLSVARPDLIRAHFKAAAAAFNHGDMPSAIANYQHVCELDPSDKEARRHLAVALAASSGAPRPDAPPVHPARGRARGAGSMPPCPKPLALTRAVTMIPASSWTSGSSLLPPANSPRPVTGSSVRFIYDRAGIPRKINWTLCPDWRSFSRRQQP